MNNWKSILLISAAIAIVACGACPEHCEQCDDSGSICFACSKDFQINVFGGCHANTIDKCVIYGPSDECFRCQPTYSLIDGKCQKSYNGCVNEGGVNQCFECAFGMSLDGNKCKGVLNCADFSAGACKKCKDGYSLSSGICKDSSAACVQTRPADGTCTKCKDGFFMSGYQCFDQKYKNDRCYTLANSDKCIYCKGGYNDADGKCLLNKQISNAPSSTMTVTTTTSTTTSTATSSNGFSDSQSFSNSFGSGFDGSNGFGEMNTAAAIANCEVPDPSGQGCVVCVYGYFPKSNACQQVSPLCDGHNVQTGDCFGCKNDLTLQSGKCVDKNCVDFDKGKCKNCQPGFKANDQGVCKQFDPNCVQDISGRCQQCKPEYYVDLSGKCKVLPFSCATANVQTGACLECIKDYQMLTVGAACTKKIVIENCQVPDPKNVGKCLICVYGYFPDDNKCTKVSSLCKDFNVQNGKCTSCVSSGFNLNDGKCIDPNCVSRNGDACATCKSNFAYKESDKICKLVDANCKNLAIAACLECNSGYYIGSQKICKALPANCAGADQTGACTSCVTGFQIYRTNCIKTVTIPNCQVVDSPNNKCITCFDRFYASDSSCLPVAQYCKGYSPNGKCTSCKSDMVLQADGTCLTPPPVLPQAQQGVTVIQNNMQTVNQAQQSVDQIQQTKQVQQNQNTQSQNSQGGSQYIQGSMQTSQQQGLAGPISVQTINQVQQTSSANSNYNSGVRGSDGNCRQYTAGKCSKCSTRYYVGVEGRCVPVNPLCKQSNLLGECTACYPGYRTDSGKCIIASSQDVNCKSFQGQQCNECYQGFFYSQNDRVCKKLNPLCRTSNLSTGACTGCYPGYSLNPSSGACQVFFKDPNCKQFNGDGTCKYCSARYYVNPNGKCSAANPLCKDFNKLNGACTACFPGYGLSNDGQCLVGVSVDSNCKNMIGSACKDCVSGFYVGPQGKCKQASPLCRTFDSRNGNCLTCYNGYEVSTGTCVIAKSQDPHCKKSDDQNGCTVCYSGYLAIKGKCTEQNPLCKKIDYNTGGCTDCWSGYVLADSNCVLQKDSASSNPGANDPYCVKIYNGVCTQCSSGYYYSKDQAICVQVDPLCKTWDNNNGDCVTCYQGYNLNGNRCCQTESIQITNCLTVGQNGQCSQCVEGTYMIRPNECKQVSILCATYNKLSGECTSCVTGHFLQDGICVFPALFDQNCIRYESAYCSKCKDSFYLSNFLCQAVDPNCTSFNYTSNTCEVCANNMFSSGAACM